MTAGLQRLGNGAVALADRAFQRRGVERGAVGDVRADETPVVQAGAIPKRVRKVFDGPGWRFRCERGEDGARAIVSGETVFEIDIYPGSRVQNAVA